MAEVTPLSGSKIETKIDFKGDAMNSSANSTLPPCPTAAEESWRRTDPTLFFLPPDEVLTAGGSPVLGTSYGLSPWKVSQKTASSTDLLAALQNCSGVFQAASFAELVEATASRLAFVIVRHGTAEVLTTPEFGSTLAFSSSPFEATAIAPASAIGTALSQRLKASSPQQLCISVSSEKSELVPLLVTLVEGNPDFSQTYSNLRITVKKGSQAELLIADAGASFAHHRHEIVVESDAVVTQLWMHLGSEAQKETHQLLERRVVVQGRGQFSDAQLFAPTGRVRVLSNIILEGPGAFARSGAAVASTGSSVLDYEPIQEHKGPGATSSLKLKMLLAGRARGVFQGLIVVDRQAQKTNAAQENKNLLLSKRARIDALPRLQILPDDVSCKHGSATGEIDDKQMYYLRTRGFSDDQARRLIIHGFVADGFVSLPPDSALFEFADSHLHAGLSALLKA